MAVRRNAFLAILAVFGFGLWFHHCYRLGPSIEGLPPEAAEGDAGESLSTNARVPLAEPGVTVRSLVRASSYTVSVLMDGRPALGAEVFLVATDKGSVSSDMRKRIGLTDSSGVLELSTAPEAQWRFVVARLDANVGYSALEDGQTRVQVQIHRGPRLEVRVRDLNGEPVPGCRVLASASGRFGCDLADENSTTWDPLPPMTATPFYGGTTSATGLWTAEGVVPAQYHLEVDHPDYFPVSGCYDGLCPVPGPTVEVQLAPILATVVEVEGDRLVSHRFRAPTSPFFAGITQPKIDRVRERLADTYPGCIVITGLSKHDDHATALLEIYGRTSGWNTHKVLLQPASRISSPVTVYLPIRGEDKTADVRVRVLDKEHTLLKGLTLYAVSPGSQPLFGDSFAVPCDEVVPVPVGDYRLQVPDQLMRRHCSASLTVRAGVLNQEELVLSHSWRRVRIVAESEAGLDYGATHGEVGCGLGTRSVALSRRSKPSWLPTGPATLSIFTASGAMSIDFAVDRGSGVQVVRVTP